MAAAGTQNYGYFGGGTPGPKSTVDRIDYANDTAIASAKSPLNAARNYLGGVSAQENAFPQTYSQGSVGSFGSGYFAGGESPTTVTTIQRLDYSNDTATPLSRGNLTQQRYNYGQSVSSTSHGYVMGGYTPSVPEPNGNLSSIERIDYSNDTSITPAVANLLFSPGTYAGGATGNVNFGYLGGGAAHPGPTRSAIQRIDYGSDTVTQVSSLAGGTKSFVAATGNKNFGYWIGGGGPLSTIERLDYSNDSTNASAKGPLATALRLGDATGNNNFGYYFGGQTVSTVQRVNYSNDTATALLRGPLSAAKYMAAATGNTSHGYYAGGGPAPITSVDRVDYSNDTVTASPRGVLNIQNRSLSGMSAREYGLPIIGSTVSEFTNIVTRQNYPSSQRGYFGGGNNPTVLSQTQRIEFSNDTVTATIRGNLTINASSADKQSGTGNVNYGYFAGSNPSVQM